MAPEEAARRIVRGLARRPPRVWLPTTLATLARLGALLPSGLRRLAARSQRFAIRDRVHED